MVRWWGLLVVPVVARCFVNHPIHQLDHEALPGGIVIPLAGVFGAGEAVCCRELEQPESIEVTDPRVVYGLLGREVVHEEVDVVGDRALHLGIGIVRRGRDEVVDREEVVTRQLLIHTHVGADRRSVVRSSGAHPEGKERRRSRAFHGRLRGCTWWWCWRKWCQSTW